MLLTVVLGSSLWLVFHDLQGEFQRTFRSDLETSATAFRGEETRRFRTLATVADYLENSTSFREVLKTKNASEIRGYLVKAINSTEADFAMVTDAAGALVARSDIETPTPIPCLADPSAAVRLSALRSLWRHSERMGLLERDSDPAVAHLARVIGGAFPIPRKPDDVRYIHRNHLTQAVNALQRPEPDWQIAALLRLSGEHIVALTEIYERVASDNIDIALAAVTSLSGSKDPMATVLLARSLERPRARIRKAASIALAKRGESILPHVSKSFRSETEVVVRAAYDSFRGVDSPSVGQALGEELRIQVREAWRCLVLKHAAEKTNCFEFLTVALDDRARRCERLAFQILGLLEGDSVVESVVGTLRFSQGAGRATALEVLSNLGDREAANLLVLLTEPGPIEERLATAQKSTPWLASLPTDPKGLSRECAQSPGRFVSFGAKSRLTTLGRRLLRLHRSEILSDLSLEALEELDKRLIEERFAGGETILRRNETCPKIYLVDPDSTSETSDIIGEIGGLDDGPSLITVTAARPMVAYSLSGSNLKELIRREPSVAMPLIKRLVFKLRQLDSKS